VGNRTAYTVTVGATTVTTYTYDAANRLTNAGGVAYAWDDRGNLTSDGVFTYTYNAAGRLVRAQSITATLAYTYTADGLRVAQSVNSSVMTTTWDLALGLAQVLATSDGALDLYGLGRIAEVRGGAWAYPLGDALGSVRQWTDSQGYVTYAAGYAPYGETLWQAGNTESAWGFTGEWWDASLGLEYLRARWYSPRDSIFVSRDPVESEPPYQYVRGNPVNWTDPSGYIVNPFKAGDQYFYSCKCGWIDTSHAGPRTELIQAVRDARLAAQEWVPVGGTYTQFGQDVVLSYHASASFVVRGNGVMTENDANEVALGIHIAWESFFEGEGQGSHFIIGPVSTFSEEDLVSDLIGFHRGLKQLDEGMSEDDSLKYFMRLCDVVGYGYYESDRATFRDIQQQIAWEYLAENGTFRKHDQWGCRPPGRWSGEIAVYVGPQFDTERVIPPIYPDQSVCSYSFSCDKQHEQFPSELQTAVTPQSPGENWSWDVGLVSREVLEYRWSPYGYSPYIEYVTDTFHDYELNPRPLNWAPTGQ
jgi:RHS repeat-associated protein